MEIETTFIFNNKLLYTEKIFNMDTTNFRTVQHSKTVITELMIPSYANFGGKIHGGILLSLMDKVAYVFAAKHAGTYCITASIDHVDFLAPVEVGELVSLRASVNYVGTSSLVIGIRITSENIKTQVMKHTNTSYFTMVAMDENHKPTHVPGLILENKDEIRRFAEVLRKKEFKKQNKAHLKQIKTPLELESYKHLLEKERCLINFA